MPTDRQTFALAHPLTALNPAEMLACQRLEEQRDGNLLVSVLAIDR